MFCNYKVQSRICLCIDLQINAIINLSISFFAGFIYKEMTKAFFAIMLSSSWKGILIKTELLSETTLTLAAYLDPTSFTSTYSCHVHVLLDHSHQLIAVMSLMFPMHY